jgi:hypothetical protein
MNEISKLSPTGFRKSVNVVFRNCDAERFENGRSTVFQLGII